MADRDVRHSRMGRGVLIAVVIVTALVMRSHGVAATADEGPSGMTRVLITTSGGPVVYADHAQAEPPAIFVEFRSRNVLMELDPVVPIASGIIKGIQSSYFRGRIGARPVKSLTLFLTQPAPYTISQTAHQVVIDIETPPALLEGPRDVGRGMTILGIEARSTTLGRFDAMGAALQQVSPSAVPEAHGRKPVVVTRPVIADPVMRPRTIAPEPMSQRRDGGFWLGLFLGAVGAGVIGLLERRQRRATVQDPSERTADPDSPSIAQASTVLDHLVLKAIRRQGERIVDSNALAGIGTMWIVEQHQRRYGVLCIDDGSLCERRAIEQFHEALQQEGLPSGTVWALGSFTAPAQDFAKQHGLKLIPRDEAFRLVEAALGAAFSQETETLRRELTGARSELIRSQDQPKAFEQERSTHAEFKRKAEAELEVLEHEVETLRNTREGSESRLRVEQSERQRLQEHVTELEATVSAKEAELLVKTRAIEELHEESKQLGAHTKELKERLEASERSLWGERMKQKPEAHAAQLRRETEALKEQLKESEVSLSAERTNRQELESHMRSLEQTRIAREHLEARTARDAEQPAVHVTQLRQEAEARKEQLKESEVSLSAEQTMRQHLESRVSQLEHALAEREHTEARMADGGVPRATAEGDHASSRDLGIREAQDGLPDVDRQKRPQVAGRRDARRRDLEPFGERGLAVRIQGPDNDLPSFIGIVKAMSASGLMAEGTAELPTSDVLAIELFPFDSLVPIEARGRLISQERQEDGAKIRADISITSISKRGRSRLTRYLKQLKGLAPSPVGKTT